MIFFIIFGTRGITYTKDSGEFHCPDCRAKQYRMRRVRRFFTLYFIPIIPLDLLGEFVECDACKATWDPSVLTHDPEKTSAEFEAKYFVAVKNTMILMMLADGVIDEDELSTVSEVYEGVTGKAISNLEVRQQADQLRALGTSVLDFLAEIGPMLNDPGREMVVRAAYMVAVADGEFDDSERKLLGEIADALHMSTAHTRGVIEEMLAASQPNETDGSW